MNRKQFLTLFVVALIMGGLGISYLNKRKSAYTSSDTTAVKKVIANFPLNDVAHVRIKQGGGEVNLLRTNETWAVQERWGYPANFSEVSGFLRKVWELKPVQDVQVGSSQFARLELVSPTEEGKAGTGTLVEFKDKNNAAIKGLLLGKKHTRGTGEESPMGGGDMPVGRYVMVPDAQPKVWLVSETFTDIEPKPESWLDKEFFKVEKTKSVSVTHPEAEKTWSLVRETETGDWKFASPKEGENIDTSKASSLNWALNSPTFDDVANPELKPEESGLDKPIIAKLETFEGFNYTLNISSKTNSEKLYIKISVDGNFPKERTPTPDEKPEDKDKFDKEFKEKADKFAEKLKKEQQFAKWTYQVSKYTVDALLKDRKDFIAEKKEEKPQDAPPTTPIRDPSAPPIELLPQEIKNLPPPIPGTPKEVTPPPAIKLEEAKPEPKKE